MIKVNDKIIDAKHFPDGTQMLLEFPNLDFYGDECKVFSVKWLYDGESEIVTLFYIVNHLRAIYGENSKINLFMPYVPNARMDRVKDDCEVFTLKYFANFINSLHFDNVIVFDAHSNVSLALLDRVRQFDIEGVLSRLNNKLYNIKNEPISIYFPDDGAMKRYKDYFNGKRVCDLLYGKKNRDWSTGKILGLEVFNGNGEKATENDVFGKTILMIDDIISYGGTLAYSADELKKLGAEHIFAYASHTENSVLDNEKGTFIKRLADGIVEKLYTTNSIYRGNHKKIELIQTF